ncbi:hypothetical protein FHP25_28370 [Vineibacter terrae]|uniref:HPt domain-containing protein n=1 Tax=Vineibacter terrae TaxID=2586908 RepID=A0A5C8PDF6_9HYPH|nr:Hpt domain-containing protein [Vineibacter terrae]TXL71786.1 hypothetical protein FHP25_28370 [Vineibacter terrae]
MTQSASFGSAIDAIRVRFCERTIGERARLDAWRKALAAEGDEIQPAEVAAALAQYAHRLAGTAGSLGFEELSRQATAAEAVAAAVADPSRSIDDERRALRAAAGALLEEIDKLGTRN